MTGECAVCGQAIVILHSIEPTEAMVDAALAAYREGGYKDDEASHVDSMREAITAALFEAAT